jgi:hypothetical protein
MGWSDGLLEIQILVGVQRSLIVTFMLIFAWNHLGDALNDVLNPRRQG